jgi:hypothetical protein
MKRFPRLFPLLIALAFAAPALAEDWMKKNPEQLAAEARKIAADLRKEAHHLQTGATQAGRSLTADEQKYVSYTIEEAELLEKSFEAWDKNQKRMADKFREKAGEICQKRGALAHKLKLWDKKPEGPFAGEKKPGSDNAAKIAEIERQQAELERKKKELEQAGR